MKKSIAFSLLELLIVLSIVLFLSAIGMPHFMQNQDGRIKNELAKLEKIIQHLQQSALATNHQKIITLDINNNHFWYEKNGKKIDFSLAEHVSFGTLPGTCGPPAHPTTIITHSCTFPSHPTETHLFHLKIFPDGKLSPGTIYIIDKKKKIMGALTCAVSQVSYIRKYVYKPSHWHLFVD